VADNRRMASTTVSAAGAIGRPRGKEGRVAFRVRCGVTGHRRLDDETRVRLRIAEQLARVQTLFQSREEATPVAYTIFTALAEGADRLVPTVAVETLGASAVEIAAVLPMTVDEYRRDFKGEASQQQFTELFDASASRVVLTEGVNITGGDRVAAYVGAGRYIVDRCDLLIAVWDGASGHGPGGTADTVEYARTHDVPVLVVPPGDGRSPSLLSGDVASKPRFRSAVEAKARIDEYNRGSVATGALRGAVATARLQHQLPSDSLIAAEVGAVTDWALPHYARADVLALKHQAVSGWLAILIHFLAACAVVPVAVVVVFAPHQTGWLAFEIAFLLALIVVVAVGRRGRVRERWLGYRSLAEALRSAVFITLAGLRDTGDPEAGDAQARAAWPQRAFSEAWRSRPRVSLDISQSEDLRRFVLSDWINDQIVFHDLSAARHYQRRTLYTRIVYLLAALTIVVAALHIAGWPESKGSVDAFTFIAITLPGFGAALTGLREAGQHRLLEERSRRTAARLRRLIAKSATAADLDSIRDLVIETHRIMAEENIGWSDAMEFQGFEVVM
jgi:hypothetical protein